MVGKDKIVELFSQQFGDSVDAPTKDYLGDVVLDSVCSGDPYHGRFDFFFSKQHCIEAYQ